MIDEIRKSLEEITPGPWEYDDRAYIWEKGNLAAGSMVAEIRGWGYLTGVKQYSEDMALEIQNANGRFIANAPTYIEYLLEQIERLEKERDAAVERVAVALYGKCYHLRTTTVGITENVGAKGPTYKSKRFPKWKQ